MNYKIKILEIYDEYIVVDTLPALDSQLEYRGEKFSISNIEAGNKVYMPYAFISQVHKGDIVTEIPWAMKELVESSKSKKGEIKIANYAYEYSSFIDKLSGVDVEVGDILKAGFAYYKVTRISDNRIFISPFLIRPISTTDTIEVYSTVKVRTETKKILLSHNTKTIKDPNKWEDYKSQTPGENGYYFEEWEVKEYPDGRIEKTKLRTYGRVEPKDSIITVGTKKYPYLWRRIKVIRTTGEVEYTGHELVNSHTKDIQKLDSYFKGYQELTDKEFKRTLEKIENQNSIIDGKFSETRTSINELKDTTDSAIRNISKTVENKLSGYTSDINTRFEQMNNRFGLYVTESTYNKDKSSYESKFSSIEQNANKIELSIAGKTDSSDVRNIFSSMTLTDRQIKSVTDNFVIESRSGTYRNEMKWGNFTSYKDGYKQFEVNQRGLEMYEHGEKVTELATTVWGGNGSNNFRLGHRNSSMTISYHNSKADAFSPYITFDKYNTSGYLEKSDYPIKISQSVEMAGNFWMKKGYRLWIGDTYYLQSGELNDGNSALYLTRDNGKYGLALVWNKLYFIKDHTLYEIFKA